MTEGNTGSERSAEPTPRNARSFAARSAGFRFNSRALEETLGVTLLERTTRKVLLSPEGERIAVRA
ncbi:hydrogen peroxide-inducible genes activator, partial [Streptomyces sp. NPDC050698]